MFGTNWVIWLTVRPRLEVEVFVLGLDCHTQRCSRLLEILFICKKKIKCATTTLCGENIPLRKKCLLKYPLQRPFIATSPLLCLDTYSL